MLISRSASNRFTSLVATSVAASVLGLPSCLLASPPAAPDFSPAGQLRTAQIAESSRSASILNFVPAAVSSPKQFRQINNRTVASDQILVKFAATTSSASIQTIVSANGLTEIGNLSPIGWHVYSLSAGTDVETLAAALKALPEVASVELNGVGKLASTPPTAVPIDDYFSSQWNLINTGFENAWARTLGNSNYWIAVLDTGILTAQPDLGGYSNSLQNLTLPPKIVENSSGVPFGINVQGSGYPVDDDTVSGSQYHGTAVASIAGAQTSFPPLTFSPGIAGASPGSLILPVKVANSHENWTDAQLAQAITDVLAYPNVKVINMSLVDTTSNSAVIAALDQANLDGILCVACAGNSPTTQYFPASYWDVDSVAASNYFQQVTAYSSVGAWNSVAAPGGDLNGEIEADNGASDWSQWQGTSMAAPQVAGLATLTLSCFPSMTPSDLRYRIEDTSTDANSATYPGFDNYLGWGIINANLATQSEGTVTVSYPANVTVLVSVPVWPNTLDPVDRSTDIARVMPTATAVNWYWPENFSYLPYSDSRVPRFGTGHGYYVKFGTSTATETYTGAVAYNRTGHLMPIHLQLGWNQIGDPSTGPVTWNKSTFELRTATSTGTALVQTLAASSMAAMPCYSYNPTTGSEVEIDNAASPGNRLMPGQGYWVYAWGECDLLIPSS